MKHLVSIIIPCYNQGVYLEETIASVLNQSYTNWECLLVNDGSTDDTACIIEKWESIDSRFKGYYQDNGGLSSARNLGLKKAKGFYIQFLDSDDLLHANKLKIALKYLQKNDLDIVVANYAHFKKDANIVTPPYYTLKQEFLNYNSILYQWDTDFAIPIHCALFKASLFELFEFPVRLKAKEDWYMWTVLFYNNPKVGYVNDTLCYYRIHANSMTGDNFNHMTNNTKLFYDLIKAEIPTDDYIKLIELSNKKYINKSAVESQKTQQIKQSQAFKIGNKIEAILRRIGLNKLSQKLIKKYSE